MAGDPRVAHASAMSAQEIVEAEEGSPRRPRAGADERRERLEKPGAAVRVGDDDVALAAEQGGHEAVEARLGQRVALISKGLCGGEDCRQPAQDALGVVVDV
jgi:hypothetical protein